MQRFERLQRMLKLINQGGYPTIAQFCELFEVKERSIYQDIQFMRDSMHQEIEYDHYHKGYYNKNPKQTVPEFELNEGEIFALTLGKDMLSEYSGTAFESILRNAITKIAERLPDRVKVNLSDMTTVVRFKTGGVAPIDRRMFFELSKACEDRKVVHLVYFSAHNGQSTFRDVEPYRLLENRGAWYLLAWCKLRGALRMFALHRISKCEIRSERFEPRDLDINKYVDEAFQLEHGDPPRRYVIKFDPIAARYIRERQWHESQELTEHEDESCTLSFSATSMDEVKRWVLTYGSSAQVLQPKELQAALKQEFQKAAALYSGEVIPHKAPAPKKRAASTPKGEPGTRALDNGHE